MQARFHLRVTVWSKTDFLGSLEKLIVANELEKKKLTCASNTRNNSCLKIKVGNITFNPFHKC